MGRGSRSEADSSGDEGAWQTPAFSAAVVIFMGLWPRASAHHREFRFRDPAPLAAEAFHFLPVPSPPADGNARGRAFGAAPPNPPPPVRPPRGNSQPPSAPLRRT